MLDNGAINVALMELAAKKVEFDQPELNYPQTDNNASNIAAFVLLKRLKS